MIERVLAFLCFVPAAAWCVRAYVLRVRRERAWRSYLNRYHQPDRAA